MNWFRQFWDPRNPVQKFDRYQARKPGRWVCGVSIDDDFRHLRACLLQSSGAGKLIRLVPSDFQSIQIPAALQTLFQNFASSFVHFQKQPIQSASTSSGYGNHRISLPSIANSDARIEDYFSIRQDLTSLASGLISQILGQSGAASEKILGAAIYHSGLFSFPSDSEEWSEAKFLPLIDSNQLAFQTGHNILDQLPARQMSDGGSPWPLSALPTWMLCADRSTPIAKFERLVLEAGLWIKATYLPPSDGFDGEFPQIRQLTLPGLALFSDLLPDSMEQFCDPNESGSCDNGHLAAQGKSDPALIKQFHSHFREYKNEKRFQLSSLQPLKNCHQKFSESIANSDCCLPDLLQSYAKFVSDCCDEFFRESSDAVKNAEKQTGKKQDKKNNDPHVPKKTSKQWILAGDSSYSGLIANLASANCKELDSSCVSSYGCPNESLNAVIAATIGFFHIDQLPCSLPWISGCQSPRILGSLTPGSPSHWRKLLLEMSDYRPPVMKLKDAV